MSLIAISHIEPPDERSDLVKSIIEKHGIPFKPYEFHNRWRGNYANKLRTAFQASKELTDYTHILFLDAFDIVVLAGVEQIMKRFEKFNHPWVCNSEPNIWPAGYAHSFKAEDYPPCDSRWPFLNSGAYLAEREYLKECFERWEIPNRTDDQWYLTEKYLHRPGCIKLDTNCELFQCLIGGWWAFESSPGRLHNNQTGTDPLILHHNGGGRLTEERMKVFYEHLL